MKPRKLLTAGQANHNSTMLQRPEHTPITTALCWMNSETYLKVLVFTYLFESFRLRLNDEAHIRKSLYSSQGYTFGNFCLKIIKPTIISKYTDTNDILLIIQDNKKISLQMPNEKMTAVIKLLKDADKDPTALIKKFRELGGETPEEIADA